MEVFGSLVDVCAILQDRLLSILNNSPPERRIIIALAGVPGSGKSTIAAALLAHLDRIGICDVVVAPMDGYHYTKATLSAFADPDEAFRRRGAPFTFDVESFVEMVRLLSCSPVASHEDPSKDIWMPSFDHAKQDPVPLDIWVPATARVVLLEGNYVLLNQHPWSQIGEMADERWFIDASRDVAKQRITQRHLAAKIEHTLQAAEGRAEANDLPNGDFIRMHSVAPEVIIKND